MSTLLHYLQAPYAVGGRGPDAYDCWGQLREARHLLCHKPLWPLYAAINCRLPRAITGAWHEVTSTMRACDPEHAAIASVFKGRLCIHVALVLAVPEGLRVLETTETSGARILTVPQFEQRYFRVEYHND